jgi:hypothetical protein
VTGYVVEMVMDDPGADLLAPAGLDTPLSRAEGLTVTGGSVTWLKEPRTGQDIARITPSGGPLRLLIAFDGEPAPYPEGFFTPIPSRYTQASEALLAEVGNLGQSPAEIAAAVAERFDYGHPERRFHDGHEETLPALGCNRTKGSCVDINMYFLAALRAAGIEAGYVAGVFFPADKGDWASDGHCWVVTQTGAGLEEWDIAHHLKMGRRDICAGLNPKPGFRAALSHGLGLPIPGGDRVKLLTGPVLAAPPHDCVPLRELRLRHPGIAPGPQRPLPEPVHP